MGSTDNNPLPDPRDKRPVILIVEDEALIRMILTDYLEECGFQVLEASDAATAIAHIVDRTVKIDLVFSDVRMPGEMDGVGLANWIKQNHPGLPIFLASAEAKKLELAHELCGNEQFFAKPYDIKIVVEHIRRILTAHGAAH